jgi:hypothetical protein
MIGFAYLYIRKLVRGVPILHGEDYKEKESVAIGASAPAE